MQIAVLSDIHDHLEQLQKVLAHIEQAEAMLCCGDFCAPFTLKAMADGFHGPIHAVFGNNDGDAFLMLAIAQQAGNVRFYKPVANLEMGGKRIAVAHYPEVGEALALSGEFDAVFSGHNHVAHVKTLGEILWGNPGEVMGRLGKATFGLYDSVGHAFEIHEVR
jgi:putative phosphoesterase